MLPTAPGTTRGRRDTSLGPSLEGANGRPSAGREIWLGVCGRGSPFRHLGPARSQETPDGGAFPAPSATQEQLPSRPVPHPDADAIHADGDGALTAVRGLLMEDTASQLTATHTGAESLHIGASL